MLYWQIISNCQYWQYYQFVGQLVKQGLLVSVANGKTLWQVYDSYDECLQVQLMRGGIVLTSLIIQFANFLSHSSKGVFKDGQVAVTAMEIFHAQDKFGCWLL